MLQTLIQKPSALPKPDDAAKPLPKSVSDLENRQGLRKEQEVGKGKSFSEELNKAQNNTEQKVEAPEETKKIAEPVLEKAKELKDKIDGLKNQLDSVDKEQLVAIQTLLDKLINLLKSQKDIQPQQNLGQQDQNPFNLIAMITEMISQIQTALNTLTTSVQKQNKPELMPALKQIQEKIDAMAAKVEQAQPTEPKTLALKTPENQPLFEKLVTNTDKEPQKEKVMRTSWQAVSQKKKGSAVTFVTRPDPDTMTFPTLSLFI